MSVSFYKAMGGRKQFNGYLMVALITAMAFPLDADYQTYCLWVAACLLGTTAAVVIEDHHARKLGAPGTKSMGDAG